MKYLFIFLLCCLSLLFSCDGDEGNLGPDGRNEIEVRAFELINNHRGTLGLAPLEHLSIAFEEAKRHSLDMAARRVGFGHDNFNQRVNTIRTVVSVNAAAENVAFNGSDTPAVTVVEQWLASQGHRNNIEDDRYTHTGLAVAQDENGLYYFTQLFVVLQ